MLVSADVIGSRVWVFAISGDAGYDSVLQSSGGVLSPQGPIQAINLAVSGRGPDSRGRIVCCVVVKIG